MGTQGLISYYYKGRYYTFWNRFDSYSDGLGRQLVSQIPKDPTRYTAWLADTRAEFERLEKYLEQNYWAVPRLVQYISDEEIEQDDEARRVLANCHIKGRDLELRYYRPTFLAPGLTLFTKWTYVIDLEVSELKVAGHHAYRALDLSNLSEDDLPDEVDHNFHDVVGANLTIRFYPKIYGLPHTKGEKYTLLRSDGVRHTLKQLSDRIDIASIHTEPDFTFMPAPATQHLAPGLVCAAEIASCIYQKWLPSARIQASILASLSKVNLDDLAYRELCFMVLAMALPHVSLADPRYFDERNKRPQVFDHDASDCFGQLRQRFATLLNSRGLEAFLCPTTSIFLLGGLMIFICPNLHDASVLRKGVEYIAKQARSDNYESYRAILLSLDHVAFVDCTLGQVKHSEAFRLWSYTQGSCKDVLVISDMAVNVFKSLIAFFEEAEIDRLGRESRLGQTTHPKLAVHSSRRLPTELWNKILPMTSPEARRACLEVSREIRLCVQEYCYVLDQEPIRTIDFKNKESFAVKSILSKFDMRPGELEDFFP